MKFIKISVIVIFSLLFIAACGETATNVNTTTTNSANAARNPANTTAPAGTPAITEVATNDDSDSGGGKEIYATNCMICHKEDGTGGKVTVSGKTLDAENLTEDKFKKMPDEKLMGYVKNGIPDEGMPAFKDKLTDEQIKAVLAHVRTLQQ